MVLKKYLLPFCFIVVLFAIYFPGRHAVHYVYMQDELILSELITENRTNTNPNLKLCNYANLIENYTEIDVKDVINKNTFNQPKPGGVYSPDNCFASIKIAFIIPYRNRSEQLRTFLNYMHYFLQQQNLEYRIIVADQNDSLPFNRAKMLNYGAKLAIDLNYHCLIFHDVDLIPLNLGNIYGCTKNPRHMSSSLDTFRYNLPYSTLLGGAVSITAKQFLMVNGYSNRYYGWGGEDDDFYKRLRQYKIQPCRFSPKISKYIMLNHKKEPASKDREQLLKDFQKRQDFDGFHQLEDGYRYTLENLYTHMYVI